MTELIHLDTARQAIIQAKDIDEVTPIIGEAEALRVYAKRAHLSLDIINDTAEIKLRGEKKAGELLAGIERSEGGRPSKNSLDNLTSFQQALRENNLTNFTAHRWQQEASLPGSKGNAK